MTDGNVATHRARTIACLATFVKTDMILIMTDRLAGGRHQRRIEVVREALLDKIRNGLLRPGERFFSARALSLRYSISYQTADRVLSQLAEEGYVVRRAQSGTFLPNAGSTLTKPQLFFNVRGKRVG